MDLNSFVRAYRLIAYYFTFLQSIALLALRLGIGLELWFTAHGHLQHADQMVKNFTDWGVPLPRASVYVSACTEGIGGLLLVAGFATRLVSIPLFFNFCVAYLTASRAKVTQMILGPGHWDGVSQVVDDAAMPFFCVSLVTLAFGAGKVSLDYLLSQMVFRGKQESPSPARPQGAITPPSS